MVGVFVEMSGYVNRRETIRSERERKNWEGRESKRWKKERKEGYIIRT